MMVAMSGCGAGNTFNPDFAGTPAVATFLLTVTPTTKTTQPFNSATYALTATSVNGFSSPVAISLTNVPAGANTSIQTTPIVPTALGTTTNVTIDGDTGAKVKRSGRVMDPGTYTVRINAVGGGVTKFVDVQLVVSNNIPD